MRGIEFRAWDPDQEKMFIVHVLALTPCHWSCPDYGKRGVSLAYQPSITVMQWTGLWDKDGVKIYEGDILTTDLDKPYLLVVRRNGSFVFKYYDNGKFCFDHIAGVEEHIETLHYAKVVGNICENSELLGA